MEGLGVVLFIVAMLASIFDQSRKGKKPPPAPPQRRPQQPQMPQPRARVQSQRAPQTSPEESGEGRASEMVSDDFWLVLTGQKPPHRVEHPPEEMPPSDLPSWDEEAIAQVEEQSRERAVRTEARSLEDYRRPDVVREEPRVVSLETELLPPEKRHAEFHRRTATPAVAPAARAALLPGETPARLDPLRTKLHDRAALRESFVLQEVFGKPKGLEE